LQADQIAVVDKTESVAAGTMACSKTRCISPTMDKAHDCPQVENDTAVLTHWNHSKMMMSAMGTIYHEFFALINMQNCFLLLKFRRLKTHGD